METHARAEPVVRHYRAETRERVEQAYRADAAQAATAGYLPVSHNWSRDEHGLLLAVTFHRAATVDQPPADTAHQPERAVQPSHEVRPQSVQSSRMAQPTQPPDLAQIGQTDPDRFAPIQPIGQPVEFAPREQDPRAGLVGEQSIDTTLAGQSAQSDRYVPPPEMYLARPDVYAAPVEQHPLTPAWHDVQPELERATAEPTYHPQLDQWAAQAPASAPAASPQATESAVETTEQQTPDAQAAPGRRVLLTIQTMDLHCAGEPLRIVRSGFPDVPSLPVLERRRWVIEHADHVRRAIIHEPRGHRDMYGAILLPPHSDFADICVLFMHNEGYSTMCGHGIIAITTGLIEDGLYPAIEPVTTIRYEVPAGIVAANAACMQLEDGSWAVQGVRFTNVPAYLAARSVPVRPAGVELHGSAAQFGALSVDIAFGGAYYGIVNAAELGLRVVPAQAEALRHAGAAITDVLRREHTPAHPTDPALSFVYGTIIVDLDPRSSPDGRATDAHIRNAAIFADAELDRSPCGSGTSAILAQLHARGRIRIGQEIVNAGITGEHFLGRIEADTVLGPHPAVSTSIAGTAYVTGYSTYIVDARDPLGEGFLLH